MADTPAGPAAPADRLQKISRLLTDLKVTEEYLRQYPALAEKVAALVEEARAAGSRS